MTRGTSAEAIDDSGTRQERGGWRRVREEAGDRSSGEMGSS